MIKMIVCKTCGEEKDESEFYSKGHECKVCTRRRTQINKMKRKENEINNPKPEKEKTTIKDFCVISKKELDNIQDQIVERVYERVNNAIVELHNKIDREIESVKCENKAIRNRSNVIEDKLNSILRDQKNNIPVNEITPKYNRRGTREHTSYCDIL